MKWSLPLLVYLVLASPAYSIEEQAKEKYRMGFGSCFAHKIIYLGSELFSTYADKYKPDSFVWLGDAVYTDTYDYSERKYHLEADKDLVKQNFMDAKNNKDYQHLLQSGVKIYGTWDDHDYGIDNGGKANPAKDLMRELFLDFLDEPKDSIRRTRKGGIYESYYLDNTKKIKLILLDNRYSKDEEKE
jgi:alkaline phosphatase D